MSEVKNFEEEKKERGIITLSRTDFQHAVADVMVSEEFSELSNESPMVVLMFTVHAHLIEKQLFGEE